MQPAGRDPFVGTHIITQNKPINKATQTTQAHQTNEQPITKQHKTNTTKEDKANQTPKPNQATRKHTKPNPDKATHDTTYSLVGWLVSWFGCLDCSRLGRALVRPGRELVIYGLSVLNNKPHGPHPVMDGPGTCTPRAVSFFVGTHTS